mmetsp:Transcript_15445/g.27063  ORF Transcript_15445/g.27063 Transcript_15445/m.27063 type:complete len:362 (-) Transcript_15445:43-1128(-)
MSLAFATPNSLHASVVPPTLIPCQAQIEAPLSSTASSLTPLAATVAAALLLRRRGRSLKQHMASGHTQSKLVGKRGLRRLLANLRPQCLRRATVAIEDASDANNGYAFHMVKIALIVTVLPFLFCLKNLFTNPALSDFGMEYGPHLAHPALRATSTIQAIMVMAAVLWREKNRDDPIDRLFAWLFVPEAVAHIFLHFFSHHWWPANFAFAYAFSAGIALPGFLSLLCYCPKERKLPWAYLAMYFATQVPIVAGLTDMVGPAKMRLNFANLNTATITSPFFYGIIKRWSDVPKLPVLLACLTITYQVSMGIMGPIMNATAVKLYDPTCIFQHGCVDIGFGLAYAASIVCGVFKSGIARPRWS